MTAEQETGDRRQETEGVHPGARLLVPVTCLLAVLTLPLVGHGCHWDDVDHEPAAAPPARAVAAHPADPKTSR